MSRSAAVELEASELRRIERDLHDGAQQRLVMLAMDLGGAEEKIDTDPAGAKVLVADAREQSRLALAELRDLVRGTAPSILIDRGLVAAVASIAGQSPVETSSTAERVDGSALQSRRRAGRLLRDQRGADERRQAQSRDLACDVIFWRDATRLFVEIWDNGHGGADLAPRGGLTGLQARAESIDGTLQVVSPPGGPTMVRATLPLTES